MKKIVLITMALGMVLFSGCASKQPKLLLSTDKRTVLGTQDYDSSNVSSVQNLAIALKKVVKESKLENFTLLPGHEVPVMITNFKDLVSYCYPENEGVDADAFTDGSTSLENKCQFGTWSTNNNIVVVGIKSSEKTLGIGTWSREQVLKDKFMNELIKNAKKDSELKEIKFYLDQPAAFTSSDPKRRETYIKHIMNKYPKENNSFEVDNLE